MAGDEVNPVIDDDDYSLEDHGALADAFDCLDNEQRVQAYDLFAQGYSPEEAADEIGINYSGVWRYKKRFERAGWLEFTAKGIELTEEGEAVHEMLQDIEETYGEII